MSMTREPWAARLSAVVQKAAPYRPAEARSQSGAAHALPLHRAEVPELFRVVHEVCAAVKAPPIDRVFLTADHELALADTPRKGVFGGRRHSLLLGLPLMRALSPEAFRTALAHELRQHFRKGDAAGGDSGPSPREKGAGRETAAQAFLGALAEQGADLIAARKRDAETAGWIEARRYVEPTVKNRMPLEVDDATDLGGRISDLDGAEAVPLLRSILERNPDHVAANYRLGQILLALGDTTGIQYLNRAVASDPASVFPVCQKIYRHLREQGRDEEASRCFHRAEELGELLRKAEKECAAVSPADTLLPHGLDEATVVRVREELAGCRGIQAAYLVRRSVACLPHRPFYVLGVVPSRGFGRGDEAEARLLRRLATEVRLPADTCVVLLPRDNKPLWKAFAQTEGARIDR